MRNGEGLWCLSLYPLAIWTISLSELDEKEIAKFYFEGDLFQSGIEDKVVFP